MLSNSEVNPFDSQEAKPYKEHVEIVAMTNLVAAYMDNRIREFEKIIKSNSATIMGDPFIKMYIEGARPALPCPDRRAPSAR